MSCSYADRLSEYADKGVLGVAERFDNAEDVERKCTQLAQWISEANHVVAHTGAGISTSAGIPDFRGPNGVWTLERQGLKPSLNISFDDAVPTITHRALKALCDAGRVQYVISQNIDGLHLKSGLPRTRISELHGNMFIEQCDMCRRQFVLASATTSVGQKYLGGHCRGSRESGRPCRGRPQDTILDWEGSLPDEDLDMAEMHSTMAGLNICLGTTLQIIPSGNLPLKNAKQGGKLVICNLQPTKHDKKANAIINTYVDDILVKVCKKLGVEIPEYLPVDDPTKAHRLKEWTIPQYSIKELKDRFNLKFKTNLKKRSTAKPKTKVEEDKEDIKKIKTEDHTGL